MPRFFCDYCNAYLTHDSAPGRQQHCRGWKHREAFKNYYQQYYATFAAEQQAQQAMLAGYGMIPPGFPGGMMLPPPPGMPNMMFRPPPGAPPMGMPPMGMPPIGFPPQMMMQPGQSTPSAAASMEGHVATSSDNMEVTTEQHNGGAQA